MNIGPMTRLSGRSAADAQAAERFLLSGRASSLTVVSAQCARSALQHIDRGQRHGSSDPHAAVVSSVLTGEGVLVRVLPDALQLLAGHGRHPLGQVILVMSQQAPDQRAASDVDHDSIVMRRAVSLLLWLGQGRAWPVAAPAGAGSPLA